MSKPDKDLEPVPKPRSPGTTKRKARVKRALAQLREQVRREFELKGADYTAEEIEAEAIERLKKLMHVPFGVRRQLDKTAPTSLAPPRDNVLELIEVAAVRRMSQIRSLEAQLGAAPRGRPSSRSLPIAVFERNCLEKGRPEVRSNVHDFMVCNPLLDAVYDDPVQPATCGVAERTVRETLQAMLDRHDPEFAVALNLEAIRELAKRHEDVGRYVSLDGTDVPAWLDQGPDYGAEHRRLANGGMTGAGHGTHDGKNYWRGHTLLVATDIRTTLPLAWSLITGGRPEAEHVTSLLDLLYRHWPECPLEYVVADRAFDYFPALHRDMEECYGVHLVSPWKSNHGDGKPGDLGTPYCHCDPDGDESDDDAEADGSDEEDDGEREGRPMTLKQSEYFMPADKRRAAGLKPGERVDLKKAKAGHRWVCDDCGNTESRRFHVDPRRHCFVPREGQHWKVDLRTALLLRRNASEAVFMQAKHRGVAGRGVNVPRWVKTDNHAGWLTGGCLLGLTLRRLAHEDGTYARVRDEILDQGLIKRAADDGLGLRRAA